MITHQKRNNLVSNLDNLSSMQQIFDEVQAKLYDMELDTEDIITAAVNTDTQSEQISDLVAALCKLVDSLRTYNARVCDLKTKLREVTTYL